jgi:hypothetical protein
MIDLDRPRLCELQTWLAQAIPCEPDSVRVDLEQMHLPELLMHYMGWGDRFIVPRPRKVVTWERFLRDPRAQAFAPALLALEQRIEKGEDLTPFLSEDIKRYGYIRPKSPKKGKRRGVEWSDKDYALNAYGVHHLHLGQTIGTDGWAKRTSELLYASFDRKSAFFVMLGDHKSFDDGTLSQAVAEMRAEADDDIKGILGEGQSPAERNKMQRYGFTTLAKVGDKHVIGGYLSSTGTSPDHTRHADRIMLTIEAYELRLDQPEFMRPWFEQAGQSFPAAPEISWMLRGCDLGIFEKTSGGAFGVLDWCR